MRGAEEPRENRVQLCGGQTLAVAVLVLSVVTHQDVSLEAVDDANRETIRAWLMKEYQGKGLMDEVKPTSAGKGRTRVRQEVRAATRTGTTEGWDGGQR